MTDGNDLDVGAAILIAPSAPGLINLPRELNLLRGCHLADGRRQGIQAAFQDERIVDIFPLPFKGRFWVVDLFVQPPS